MTEVADEFPDGEAARWYTFEALGVDRLYELLALRQVIFVVEQACAYLDADGRDQAALHLLLHDPLGLAAAARCLAPGVAAPEEAAIGRVVVRADRRGEGLGRRLMVEALRGTRARWPGCAVHLSAQAHLRRLYESVGFEVCGDGYLEDGIPHLPMRARAG